MTPIHGTVAEPLVRWRPATLLALIAAVALITVAAFGSYAVGSRHLDQRVLIGTAIVGHSLVSVRVDDWTYGFTFGPGTMTWYDRNGHWHQDDGIAPCLRVPAAPDAGLRHVRITFAEVPASGPHLTGWRQVLWVRCGWHPAS